MTIEDNMIWVQVTLTVNDVDVCYTTSVSRALWAYPEYQIGIIKSLKLKAIEAATRGVEPKVEVFDEMPPGGAPIPELAAGGSFQIGVHQ